MSQSGGRRVLTINAGSASLKAAVYQMNGDGGERRLLRLEASRIGGAGGRLHVLGADGACLFDGDRALPDFGAALDAVFEWTDRADQPVRWDVAGHRVVHGGSRYSAPARLTPEVLSALDDLVPVDPAHMPQALACIRAVHRAHPDRPQVVCFDTSFHHTMPPVARTYAIPRRLSQAGIVRYGFHGLSYEYVSRRLCEVEGAPARGRAIIAHLGNGASMAALRDGCSVDTSMGFSPLAGLMMGTRCGDIDPGLVLYLLRHEQLSPDQVSDLLSARSGLLGVSETSQDMRDLLEREATDARAACAIDLFCYQAAKYIGAYAAVLGGLELLVFTAGIGERAAPIRERICSRLGFLGLELDSARNRAHERLISTDASRVRVRIVKTNEELMIARHASRFAR